MQMVVDLNNWTCTCRKWELSGIPCKHAISCIHMIGDRAENYVHKCYWVENYMKAYGVRICPMVGVESWESSDRTPIKPPNSNNGEPKKRGRMKTTRRKSLEETVERTRKYRPHTLKVSRKGSRNKCSLCNEFGHKRTWHSKHAQEVHIVILCLFLCCVIEINQQTY
ncbi:hypothetical protein LINGRAHAP2_LOCUS4067 [Linum grandiflorum]